MADTVCHATQGGLLLLAPFISRLTGKTRLLALAGAGALFGALPDLLGAWGTFVLHDHWQLYASPHSGAIARVLQFVPMYGLHLAVDAVTHGPGKRWWSWSERLWVDIILWALNFLILYWYAGLWRRNTCRGR